MLGQTTPPAPLGRTLQITMSAVEVALELFVRKGW